MIKFRYSLLASLALLTFYSCDEQAIMVASKGYLSLNISAISIDPSPAGGRTKTVATDDFVVKIFRVGEEDPVVVFDPWSSAPSEIELETGQYYAEAQNLDPPSPAAFEQPWYYGTSDAFTIDKEELKTIEVPCSMANFKVAFIYSENVLNDFTNWQASAQLIAEGDGLTWPKGDDREGYFSTSPLSIEVHLEYTKVFTGELITRNFTATIDDPQPATLYRLSVDASLENGEIRINISVNEDFEVVDIPIGDGTGG
jgi:hypothetical protein